MKAVILSFVSAFAVVSVARAEGVVSAEGLALQGHCVVKFDDGEGLFNRRLGMFVHWGVYSVNGYHEQERMRRRMPRAEYEKCVKGFTAEKFDADKFIDAAESLGAEYVVFTSKHHDGFCMWDTKTTDFKVTNAPAKRDVLKELSVHVYGIPADRLDGESVVIRLDFQ